MTEAERRQCGIAAAILSAFAEPPLVAHKNETYKKTPGTADRNIAKQPTSPNYYYFPTLHHPPTHPTPHFCLSGLKSVKLGDASAPFVRNSGLVGSPASHTNCGLSTSKLSVVPSSHWIASE